MISPYHPALAPRRTGRRVVTWYSQLSLCEVGFVISTIQAVFLVTITSFYHGILPLLLCWLTFRYIWRLDEDVPYTGVDMYHQSEMLMVMQALHRVEEHICTLFKLTYRVVYSYYQYSIKEITVTLAYSFTQPTHLTIVDEVICTTSYYSYRPTVSNWGPTQLCGAISINEFAAGRNQGEMSTTATMLALEWRRRWEWKKHRHTGVVKIIKFTPAGIPNNERKTRALRTNVFISYFICLGYRQSLVVCSCICFWEQSGWNPAGSTLLRNICYIHFIVGL